MFAWWQRQTDEFAPSQREFLLLCCRTLLLVQSEPYRLRAKQITPLCLYRAVASQVEEQTGLRQLYSGVETLVVSAEIGACLPDIRDQKSVGLILHYVL